MWILSRRVKDDPGIQGPRKIKEKPRRIFFLKPVGKETGLYKRLQGPEGREVRI
jgi:hypothetical protein